jgi:hypothetical protein
MRIDRDRLRRSRTEGDLYCDESQVRPASIRPGSLARLTSAKPLVAWRAGSSIPADLEGWEAGTGNDSAWLSWAIPAGCASGISRRPRHAECLYHGRTADLPLRFTCRVGPRMRGWPGLAGASHHNANTRFDLRSRPDVRLCQYAGCAADGPESGQRTACNSGGDRATLALRQAEIQASAGGGARRHGHDRSGWCHEVMRLGLKSRTLIAGGADAELRYPNRGAWPCHYGTGCT